MRTLLLFAFLFSALLAGCGGLELALPVDGTPTVQPTPGLEEDEPAGEARFNGICSYVWTSRAQPELTSLLAKEAVSADMLNVEINVFTYGENCVDIVSNTVYSYAPRQTNYSVSVDVNSIEDRRGMGDWVMRVSNLIEQTPGALVAGTAPGRLDVLFRDEANSLSLNLPVARVREHIQKGLRGSALLDALEHDQQP